MAESTQSQTWGGIRRSLAAGLGFTRDESSWTDKKLDILNENLLAGIVRVYQPPVLPGESVPHVWSWIQPVRSIVVRPEVTGVLNSLLSPAGSEWIVESTLDVFTSTMVGLIIQFDDSGARYTIVEFISTTKVLAKTKAPVEFANIPTGKLVSAINEFSGTDIVATTAKFVSDMVGDTINFTSGSSYEIIAFHSTTKVTVAGNASAESGTFDVERTATLKAGALTLTNLGATASVFRVDMEDESDTITFTATSNVVTIQIVLNVTGQTTASAVKTTGTNLVGTETDGDTFTIKRSLTASTTTFLGKTLLEVAPGTFEQSMVGQYVRFNIKPFNIYLIEELRSANGDFVRVAGHAGDETIDFGIVENVGTVTGPIVYDGTASTVNITAANFTSTMVGMVLIFQKSGNEYAITAFTDTTTVAVAGNAGGEASQDDVFMVGPGSEISGAAFTLIGGSGYIYDLPDDFGGMLGNLTFDPNKGFSSLPRVSEVKIRERRQLSSSTGLPRMFATRPKSVTTAAVSGQRHEILIDPEPDKEYTFNYSYLAIANLPDSFDHFPLGGPPIADLILLSAKAAADENVNDTKGVPWTTFMERMVSCVATDRLVKGATTLGMMINGMRGMTASQYRRLSVGNLVVQGTEIVP